MTVTLSAVVTANDIKRGVANDCRRCPTAIAIVRAINSDLNWKNWGLNNIEVHAEVISFRNRRGEKDYLDLPSNAQAFEERFAENAQSVTPYVCLIQLER